MIKLSVGKMMPIWVLCSVLGLDSSRTFASTIYDITVIGPTDVTHTRSTDSWRYSNADLFNEVGQAVGYAERYNGSTFTGYSAWLYDGMSTMIIGLTDAGYTRDDDYQFNYANALNESGQAIGYADRYDGATYIGRSAWLYNGTNTIDIGLTDAGHTNSFSDYQFNESSFLNDAGTVVGYASRFNGSTDTGQSAWLYNGASTTIIGLTDVGHTNSSTNYQYNEATALNEAGQAVGYAQRYNGSTFTGYSAWLANDGSTVNIGLTDTEHTRTTDGYQLNEATALNEAGQALGYAYRFNGSTDTGQSAWLYNGASTTIIGLTDAGHTDSSTGSKTSYADFLNEAGQATGYSYRYDGSTFTGYSAWLYNGTNTVNIGLTDTEHTRDDGFQVNAAEFLNNAGQVAGYASRYDGGNPYKGQTAWFYDSTIDQIYAMDLDSSIRPSDGYSFSTFSYLDDDGLGLGYYSLFDTNSVSLGNRAFSFTVEDGFIDLGSLVVGGLNDAGWKLLADAIYSTGTGAIIGDGLLTDMTNTGSQVAYILTPHTVPVPSAIWLFGSGLVGLFGMSRRKSTA